MPPRRTAATASLPASAGSGTTDRLTFALTDQASTASNGSAASPSRSSQHSPGFHSDNHSQWSHRRAAVTASSPTPITTVKTSLRQMTRTTPATPAEMIAAIIVTPLIRQRLGSFDELEHYSGFASHRGILGYTERLPRVGRNGRRASATRTSPSPAPGSASS